MTTELECRDLPPAVAVDHISPRPPTPPLQPVLPATSSKSSHSLPHAPPTSSIPYANIPLSSREMLQLQQESSSWIDELLKKSLFEGLDVQILCDSGLRDKVASLLGIAYETRDLHIIELLALEIRHRREAIALELRKRTLLDARAKISVDYTELDDVKFILSKRGFAEEVDKYTTRRDAPVGCRIPPSDFAYVYHPQATDVHSTASGSRCANSNEPRSVLSGGVVIRV